METTKQERYTGTFSERVIAWATDRNIIGGSTPRDQFLKLVEEVGELAEGLLADDLDEIKDGIGDSCVVIAIIFGQYGFPITMIEDTARATVFSDRRLMRRLGDLSKAIQKGDDLLAGRIMGVMVSLLKCCASNADLPFDDCCEHAWNQIKDRRGKLIGGMFVKEG